MRERLFTISVTPQGRRGSWANRSSDSDRESVTEINDCLRYRHRQATTPATPQGRRATVQTGGHGKVGRATLPGLGLRP